MRAVCVFALVLAACEGPPALMTVDGSTVHDAGVDAVVAPDAGPTRTRPAGYRLLHAECGAWDYVLDDPATFDTPEELAVAMADARCQWSLACDDTTSSACDPIRVQSFVELHQPVDTGLARACLQGLAIAACDRASQYAAEILCSALTRGGAPEGSPCSANRFCRSLDCEGATESCGGTCGPARVCPSDCTGACVGGECVVETFAALGDPCRPEGSLGAGPSCGPHLVCPDAGACVARPVAGEPCLTVSGAFFPEQICDEGLVCDGTNCLAPVVVADGQTCNVFAICHEGSECFAGVCTHTPVRGEPCRADRFCTAGSICNAEHVCAAMVGPGCACDGGSGCPLAFRCVDGACQRVGVATVACTDSLLDCDGTPCVDGHCFLRLLRRACSLENACDEGHCRPHGIGVCTPTVPSGGACFDDPYGCGTGETCIDFTTFCALPDDAMNPCVPGFP